MGWVQERVGTLTSALGLQKAPASMDLQLAGGGGSGDPRWLASASRGPEWIIPLRSVVTNG